VEDLLTGMHYRWHDRSNYVALRPDVMPAHVFRVTRIPPLAAQLDARF
jgi:starch synthase (maltosyl-transferring)